MDVQERECESVGWTHFAEDRVLRLALLHTVMYEYFWIPKRLKIVLAVKEL
jgi:hypothetical protein